MRADSVALFQSYAETQAAGRIGVLLKGDLKTGTDR